MWELVRIAICGEKYLHFADWVIPTATFDSFGTSHSTSGVPVSLLPGKATARGCLVAVVCLRAPDVWYEVSVQREVRAQRKVTTHTPAEY